MKIQVFVNANDGWLQEFREALSSALAGLGLDDQGFP